MRKRRCRTLTQISAGMLLFASVQSTPAITLDFENLSDGDAVTSQFAAQGVTFSNATVLSAGISLNEFESPPKSGSNVVSDDGGPITVSFTVPVLSFGAFFTYAVPITLSAFDAGANLLASITSAFSSNLALSGDPGSLPNESLQIAGVGSITSITITGDQLGSSFVADDVQFNPVPEPGTLLLSGSVLAFFAIGAGRK
jgi:hypothetical protein